MKALKIYSVLMIIFLFFSLTSQAQLGIKAGYNLSSLKYFSDTDLNFNEEFINGYQFGLVYRAGLGDKLSFQPEAEFYTTGGKSDFFAVAITRAYQYAKLNGLVNYNIIGDNDGISAHLTGGVYAAYAIKAQLDIGQGKEDVKLNDQDIYERTNLGYIIGVGVKMNRFILSLRGSIGVSDLLNIQVTDNAGNTSDLDIKSREFSLVGIVLF